MYQQPQSLFSNRPKQNKFSLAPSGGLSVQELKAMTAKRLEDIPDGMNISSTLPQIQARTLPSVSGFSAISTPNEENGKVCLSVQDIKELTRARLAKEAEVQRGSFQINSPQNQLTPIQSSTMYSSGLSGKFSSPLQSPAIIRPDPIAPGYSNADIMPYSSPQNLTPFLSPQPLSNPPPIQHSNFLTSQQSISSSTSTSSRLYYRSTVLDSVAEVVPGPTSPSRPSSRPETSPRASLDGLPMPIKEKPKIETPISFRSQLQRHQSASSLGLGHVLTQTPPAMNGGTPPPPRLSLVKQFSLPDLNRDGHNDDSNERGKASKQMLPEVKQMFLSKEKERNSPSFGSLTVSNLKSREIDDPRKIALDSYHFVISRDNSKSDVYTSPPLSPREPIALQCAESLFESSFDESSSTIAGSKLLLSSSSRRRSSNSPFIASSDYSPQGLNFKHISVHDSRSGPLNEDETRVFFGNAKF